MDLVLTNDTADDMEAFDCLKKRENIFAALK